MAKKDKVIYQRREFLNEDLNKSAFVVAFIEEFTYNLQKTHPNSYPSLDIADCFNKATLDFGFHNEAEMRKSQAKLHKLKEVIDGLAEAFDSEVDKFEKAKKKAAVARKKKGKTDVKTT